MEKNIKNYLHLYLGCEVVHGSDETKVMGKMEAVSMRMNIFDCFIATDNHGTWYCYESIKPILRPLSDMIDEEGKPTIIVNAAMTAWLLSKHFDLFGLHDAGLCLYKTDL